MWKVECNQSVVDSKKMNNFTLSISKGDILTYPSGKRVPLETDSDLEEFKEDRLRFYDSTGSDEKKIKNIELDFKLSTTQEDLTITVKNLDASKKYRCRIYLGEGQALKKPKLQSPYLLSSKLIVSFNPINPLSAESLYIGYETVIACTRNEKQTFLKRAPPFKG